MAQTTVQVPASVRLGNVKWEMGATVGSLVDVGALKSAKWEYRGTPVKVKSANAGVLFRRMKDEECGVSGDAYEINLERLASFYAGVLTHATVAAAPVAVTNESQTLTGTTENVLTHRNGDGTEVSTIVATNVAGTTTYVRDCDYVINVNADGYTTIARAYPFAIMTALADVTVATPALTYTTAAGTIPDGLSVGDHIYVSGANKTGNNGVKTITAVTPGVAGSFTVAEACTAEVPGDLGVFTVVRGAILTAGVVYVDYSYTPLASRTLKGGGLTEFTARVCRFTNTNSAGKLFRITVYSTTPDTGIVLDFPEDDADEPMICPISMTGVPDTTLTAGEQLFEIYDEQHTS